MLAISVAEPNMILARLIEKKVAAYINSIQEKCLIMEKNNKDKTIILDLLFDMKSGIL